MWKIANYRKGSGRLPHVHTRQIDYTPDRHTAVTLLSDYTPDRHTAVTNASYFKYAVRTVVRFATAVSMAMQRFFVHADNLQAWQPIPLHTDHLQAWWQLICTTVGTTGHDLEKLNSPRRS